MKLLAAVALIVVLGAGAQQSKQPQKKPGEAAPPPVEFIIPPEESKRENPLKGSPGTVDQGRRLFASQCAMCHGANGDGKGDLAEPMKLKMRDYRDPAALKDFTDGDLFYIMTKGKDQMPGEGDRMKADQKWHLVNFIRSLAKKETKEEKKL